VQPRTVSVVVEWENVLLARSERCTAMLRRLAREVQALDSDFSRPLELLVCFDDAEVEEALVAAAVATEIPTTGPHLRWRLVPAPRCEYYEMKNVGAHEATGEIVVFVDSDVIPEEGWLRGLLGPFSDQTVGVVAGNSYIDPQGLYGKAFALTWFFPLRTKETQVAPASHFFANNVAFRREVLARFPFPSIDGTSRGSCSQLAQALLDNGIRVLRSPAAQVSHPPPNGLRHFGTRALAEGRDRLLLDASLGMRRRRILVRSLARLWRDLRHSAYSIVRRRQDVGLSIREAPVALAISTTYYLLSAAGELATALSPGFMARRFRI
jgi:hypothetical protein